MASCGSPLVTSIVEETVADLRALDWAERHRVFTRRFGDGEGYFAKYVRRAMGPDELLTGLAAGRRPNRVEVAAPYRTDFLRRRRAYVQLTIEEAFARSHQ
jgi:hypothetical protein